MGGTKNLDQKVGGWTGAGYSFPVDWRLCAEEFQDACWPTPTLVALDSAAVGADLGDGTVGYSGGEWRAADPLVVETDVDLIVATRGRKVSHRTRSVAIVPALDGRFRRAFYRHAQTSWSGAASIDDEFGRFSGCPAD